MPRHVAALLLALTLVGAAAPAAADVVNTGVTITPLTTVPEGTTFTFTARYDGSGGAPDGDVRIRWDGTDETLVDPPTATPYRITAEHAFADDGPQTIRVWFRVGSDLYRASEDLIVTNVAPTLARIRDAFAPVGERWELAVDFADPGADRWTITVDWGDGGSSSRDAEPGDRFAHTYTGQGTFTARVSVTDHDGGSDDIEFPVTVGDGCFGRAVTTDMAALGITRFTGGDGADVVLGSSGDDVIDTGGGDDAVCAGGGDDTVTAGSGDDLVDGGPGSDRIEGQGGADALLGGDGGDLLIGGGGGDVLHGGTGRDTLQGGKGADFLLRSEDPSRDTMRPGKGADVSDVGKRGRDGSIRNYLTAEQALALAGAAKLSDFTTYHPVGQNRVINIQTIADALSGYLVMPGEWFSLNDLIGPRTTAKGYVQAGAIIAGWVQCCDNAANIGGGTSQFATTFYNAIFFSGLEDVPVSLRSRPPNIANSPHTLWFSKYPAGREATMGYPDNDVRFRNDTDTAVLIVTVHGPRATADHITVRMYGNTGGRTVEAVHSCRPPLWTIFPDVNAPDTYCATYTTSQKVYQANRSLGPRTSYTTPSQPGFRITVTRVIHWPDGHTTRVAFPWAYDAGPIIIETHPCNIPRGYAGYTGERCPATGGGGGSGGL